MRLRYLWLLIFSTAAYVGCAYAALYALPVALTHTEQFARISDPSGRATLILKSQDSIRSGAVTLLTGSALGIAGLVAFLSFSASRRDAEHQIRSSQDKLFTKALSAIENSDSAASVGSVSLLGSIARDRSDLREPAASALFALTRARVRLSAPLDDHVGNRTVDDLANRDPLAAAALKVIGLMPGSYSRSITAGAIAERGLEGCDLRRWKISGACFEVVSFSRSYLWDSMFIDCKFVKCVFGNVDWAGVQLLRVQFIDCDLSSTNLTSAHGSDVRSSGCIGLIETPEWLTVG
jgi:uncharacterized protein YjbI with pentapeptide repeats